MALFAMAYHENAMIGLRRFLSIHGRRLGEGALHASMSHGSTGDQKLIQPDDKLEQKPTCNMTPHSPACLVLLNPPQTSSCAHTFPCAPQGRPPAIPISPIHILKAAIQDLQSISDLPTPPTSLLPTLVSIPPLEHPPATRLHP